MVDDPFGRAVNGAELDLYITNAAVQAAFAAKLAPGGSEDISKRIGEYYGIPKNFPASYIPRFVQLANLTQDAREFISILAPHTHWSYSRPIIYKFDAVHDRYIVGLHAINPRRWYRPVSFIAHKGAVFAYEWLDDSVELSEIVRGKAVSKIHAMLKDSLGDAEPISLGVDFRFRDSKEPKGFHDESGSVEFPVNVRNAESQDFSLIVRGSIAQKIDFGSRESLAVGWPCGSIGHFDLSADKARLLEGLKAMLAEIPDLDSRAVAVSALLQKHHQVC